MKTSRRGFAVLLVLWVAAISAVLISAALGHSYAQAVAGREAVARVRATWAARSGVELALARAEFDAQNPDIANAYAFATARGRSRGRRSGSRIPMNAGPRSELRTRI
jgi:type II secretory pathway component PulK